MKVCVFCNSPDNLNTVFNIKLDDGSPATVYICDAHADDATPKLARDAFIKKQETLEALLSQAKALGFDISINAKTGLSHAQSSSNADASPATTSNQEAQQNIHEEVVPGGKLIATSKMNDVMDKSKAIVNVQGAIPVQGAHSIDNTGSKLLDGKVKPEVFEGQGGMPLVIPSVKIDNTGITHITIKKTNPSDFDRNFRDTAKMSIQEDLPGFSTGYDAHTRKCPLCKGRQMSNVTGKPCEACNGEGFIQFS